MDAETEITNDECFSLNIIINNIKTSSNFHLCRTILNFTSYEDVRGVAIKKPDCFYYSFPATSMTKRRVGH